MRKTLMSLALGAVLAGGACSSTSTTLKKELGATPQEQLQAERASCQKLGNENARLRDELDLAVKDRDAMRATVAESERQRLDAERRLEDLRREMAKKGPPRR